MYLIAAFISQDETYSVQPHMQVLTPHQAHHDDWTKPSVFIFFYFIFASEMVVYD